MVEEIDESFQLLKRKLESSEILMIRNFGRDIASFFSLLNESDNWGLVAAKGSTKVHRHKEESTGHYFFKVKGIIQCPLLYVVAALSEVELYREWMPGVYHSEVLQKLSLRRQLVRSLMDFKILKRENLMVAFGEI